MPGLSAVASTRPDVRADELVRSMASRLRHFDWQVLSTWGNDGVVGVGAVALEHLSPHALFVADARSAAVFDGELHDVSTERARLERHGVRFEGSGHAELVFRGWLADGPAFLSRLHGAYSAVIWNGLEHTLTVITDRLGMRPTYVSHVSGRFAVASEVKALLSLPGASAAWDENGLSQFFAFGQCFGDDTLRRDVRALPPAVVVVYHTRTDTIRQETYWKATPRLGLADPAAALDALEVAVVGAVERRAAKGEALGLSLSGGLDARTLLGVMPPGLDLKTVSLGIEGSLDHRSSTRLAAEVGVPHRNYVLDSAFLTDFPRHLADLVHLTDGHYLDQGIVMPTLPLYRTLGIRALHRGHGGELMHMRKAYAYSLDDDVLESNETGLERWLFAHLTSYMLQGVPGDLFTFDVAESARTALRAALRRTEAADRPVDRVWPLFVNERLHRETALSMSLFNNYAAVRMPLVDADVVEVLLGLPAHAKLGEALQQEILRRRRPAFLAVTNANTGAAVGAPAWRRQLAYLRMRVAAKLGVRGYQPYERLGLWLRRELRGFVEATLSSEAIRDSGVVNPDVLARVVAQHMAGEANRTFLLMALLIVTLGRQETSDRRELSVPEPAPAR